MTVIPDPQIYRAAADVIRENGWHQGDYYEPVDGLPPAKCPVCIMGALRVVAAGDPAKLNASSCEAVSWLTDLHIRFRPGAYTSLDEWNDEDGREVADVLDFLDTAAVEAESARAAAGGDAR